MSSDFGKNIFKKKFQFLLDFFADMWYNMKNAALRASQCPTGNPAWDRPPPLHIYYNIVVWNCQAIFVKKVCEIIHKKSAQKIAYSLLSVKKARHTLAAPAKKSTIKSTLSFGVRALSVIRLPLTDFNQPIYYVLKFFI